MPIMNSNTAAQQTNSFLPPATHQSHHRFNSTGGTSNEGPWLLQSQVQQMPPTAPLRQHKRPAPQPGMSSSQTQLNQLSVAPKPIVLHPPQVPPHTTNVSYIFILNGNIKISFINFDCRITSVPTTSPSC